MKTTEEFLKCRLYHFSLGYVAPNYHIVLETRVAGFRAIYLSLQKINL